MAFYGMTEGRSLGAGEFLAVGEPCTRETVNVEYSEETAKWRNGASIVPAGTVYPSNDASAKGIIYEDVDVTMDYAPGSLVTAGTVYNDFVKASDAAKTALTGIKFVERPAVYRNGETSGK